MNALSAIVPARVLLLALPETTPTSIYGLHEIFSSVGVAWSELTGETTEVRRVEARIVTSGGRHIISPLGTPIVPGGPWQNADRADAIIVTDLALSSTVRPYGRWVDEAAWVREQYEGARQYVQSVPAQFFLPRLACLMGSMPRRIGA